MGRAYRHPSPVPNAIVRTRSDGEERLVVMETVERLGGEDEGGGAGPSTPTQLTPPPSLLIRIRLSAMAAASADFMVEDLKKEREGSKLNNQELTHFLDGGEWMTEKRRKICNFLASFNN